MSREDQGAQVRRWRRGRHDRLYVTGADGRPLGYLDVTTRLPHNVPPPRRDDFDAALDAFYAAHRRARLHSVDAPAPPVPREPHPVKLRPLEAAPLGTPVDDDEPATSAIRPPQAPMPITPGTFVPGPRDAPLVPLIPPPHPADLASADDPQAAPPAPPRVLRAVDLAANRPGENARRTAQALTAARPVRTRIARVLRRHTDADAFRRGAAGEVATARALRHLVRPWWSWIRAPRRPWYVLHSIAVGTRGADIDHLLIGPAGVFSLNTKNLRGRVWVGDGTITVNGAPVPYSTKAAREAQRVRTCLEPLTSSGRALHVVPVVVVVTGTVTGRPVTSDGVHVLPVGNLARWLQRRGPILPPDQVEELYEAARVSTVWSPNSGHHQP